jgi:putative spermidine/putrescine transport system permease protein
VKRLNIFNWVWVVIGAVYFIFPLVAVFLWSLQKKRGVLGFSAYDSAFSNPGFAANFGYSLGYSVLTIAAGILLIVPSAYWVHLRLPRLRPVMEFISNLPFVVPPIILVFGIIGVYSRPPLRLTTDATSTTVLLIAGYLVLSLPYMYRSVDLGLRAMDVNTLTEAGQSLGASPWTILFRVILPGLRTALVNGSMITLATVMGEYVLASYLALPAYGPYMWLEIQDKVYEPGALALVSLGLTWIAMAVIYFGSRGGSQAPVAGGH